MRLFLVLIVLGSISQLKTQVYSVTIDGSPALINAEGQVVFKMEGSGQFGEWSDGMISFAPGFTKHGYLDDAGKVVIPPQFDLADPFIDGYAMVKSGEQILIIDKKGNPLPIPVPSQYSFRGHSNGIFLVETSRKVLSYINTAGTVLFTVKNVNDNCYPFREGMSLVSMDKSPDVRLYGFVDKQGQMVIPYRFQRAYSFSEGRALVMEDYFGKFMFIDTNGKTVFRTNSSDVRSFSDGLALVVEEGGIHTFLDNQGNSVFQLEHGIKAVPFSDGLALINRGGELLNTNFMGGLNGFVNTSGEIVIPLQYEYATPFKHGLAFVRKRSGGQVEEGYIKTSGSFIWKKGEQKASSVAESSEKPKAATFNQVRSMILTGNVNQLKTALQGIRAEINKLDKNGMTLLSLASFQGKIEIVKLLVENGADVNQANEDGSSALSQARSGGQIAVVEFLRSKGGK